MYTSANMTCPPPHTHTHTHTPLRYVTVDNLVTQWQEMGVENAADHSLQEALAEVRVCWFSPCWLHTGFWVVSYPDPLGVVWVRD